MVRGSQWGGSFDGQRLFFFPILTVDGYVLKVFSGDLLQKFR